MYAHTHIYIYIYMSQHVDHPNINALCLGGVMRLNKTNYVGWRLRRSRLLVIRFVLFVSLFVSYKLSSGHVYD